MNANSKLLQIGRLSKTPSSNESPASGDFSLPGFIEGFEFFCALNSHWRKQKLQREQKCDNNGIAPQGVSST
jgi:hypothetical protein